MKNNTVKKTNSIKKPGKRKGPTPEELDQMSVINKVMNAWINSVAKELE